MPSLGKFAHACLAAAVGLSTVLGGGEAFAAPAAEFGARRFPLAPVLEQDLNHDLCSRVLGAMNEAHLGDKVYLEAPGIVAKTFGKVPWQEIAREENPTTDNYFRRADLDLDGKGRTQTVAMSSIAFNWRGSWHHGLVFPSPAAFDAVQSQWREWSTSVQDDEPSPGTPVLGGRGFYPLASGADGRETRTGTVWTSPDIFSFAERYYFLFASSPENAQLPSLATLYRLRAAGGVEPVCVISQPSDHAAYQEFSGLPDVESWLSVVRSIADPGPDKGTLRAESRHRGAAEKGERTAATRPWAMDGREEGGSFAGPYYHYGWKLDAFLEQWSLQEPWTRREYQTLRSLMPPAIRSYSLYLQRQFGMTSGTADAAAFRVLSGVLAQHIIIPSGYERYGVLDEHLQGLSTQSITSRNPQEFELMLGQVRQGKREKEVYSRLLPMAVEWPQAFDRLLELGADPNAGNYFGKTPLMVAAHLNRPDAVRKLLRAGAQVNAQTQPFKDWLTTMDRSGRTALMYAAENAGPLVLQLLLDAGADTSLKDSQKSGLDYYLARNPRLEHAASKSISDIAKQAAQSGQPSFDCQRAKQDVELAICTSEVLRMLDQEIASTYAQLKPRRGPELIAEQRAWLASRKSACAAADTDCLAELMRTRARALQMRATER
jgi:uncharacterized protein YecT (DUF1311 family)